VSYSVFRIQGIRTTGDLKGLYKHNVERVSHTNKDIDKSRSNENIVLVQCDNYNKKFNKIVAPMKLEHDERMKTMRADRVKTFDQHINSSKNDVAFESIFTSDKEFFKDMSKADIKDWAEKSLEFLVNDIGISKSNIIHAEVHMDEETPHLHVISTPLVKTYNKKRNAEVWSISRRQFISGKQQLSIAQDIYNKRMNENGYKLERGEKGSDKAHTPTVSYKKQQLEQLDEEVYKAKSEILVAHEMKKNIKGDINALESNLKALESEYEAVKDIKGSIWDISHVDVKKSLIGGKVTLAENDYNNIVALAKQGVHNANKIQKLINENNEIRNRNNSFENKFNNVNDGISKVVAENKRLKDNIKDFKAQGEAMFETLKKYDLIPEAKEYMEAKKVSNKVLDKNKGYEMGD